jgi:hypothetical protein
MLFMFHIPCCQSYIIPLGAGETRGKLSETEKCSRECQEPSRRDASEDVPGTKTGAF